MAEQKLPKHVTSAEIRHVPRKMRENRAFRFKGIQMGCKTL
jgi:hypothetical protein